MIDPRYAQMMIMILSTTLLAGSGTLLYATMSTTESLSIELTRLAAKTMQIESLASDLLRKFETTANGNYRMAIDIAKCQENVDLLKRRLRLSDDQ